MFASKGFEGARVKEIAEKAGVNKALLYYYFESKEAILNELIEINAKDFLEQKAELFNDLGLTEAKFIFKKIDDFIELIYELFTTKKEVVRIMLSQALKSGANDTVLFDFFQLLTEDTIQRARDLGFKTTDSQYLKTIAIFMGMMPVYLFIILGDKWSEYSGYDQEDTKEIFLDTCKQVYLNITSDILTRKVIGKFFRRGDLIKSPRRDKLYLYLRQLTSDILTRKRS